MSYYRDKVVWITGASSGLGKALARALDRRGACLVLSSRRADVLEEVRGACQRPEKHFVVPVDLADSSSLAAPVAQVLERFGHVDILLNNAGVSQRATAAETELAVDRRILDVNFFGPVALTKCLLPSMLQRHAGQIVVVSSLLGKFGVATRTAYAASKHALHGYFDSLRAEVASHGIGITLVCPGFVRTNASINALTGEGKPHGKMDETIDKGISAEDCAERILRAVERRKCEAYVARKEKLVVYLNRLAPGLCRWILARTNIN